MSLVAESNRRLRKPAWQRRRLVDRFGRYTVEYWMLREGMTQAIRREWNNKLKRHDWMQSLRLSWLLTEGFIEARKGPRNKHAEEYTTTNDGCFAVLIADGQHAAWQERLAKTRAKRAAKKASLNPEGNKS